MIVAVMAMVATAANAQTEKGKIVVSGSTDLSFSSMTMSMEYDGESMGDDVSVSEIGFETSVSYFVIDNLALGLNFDVESTKMDDNKSNSYMVGPTARYYFGSSNIKPYAQADYLFGSQTDDESTAKMSGWDIGAGVGFFLNDVVSIDLGLAYGSLTAENEDDDKMKIKGSGLAFNAGFSIFF